MLKAKSFSNLLYIANWRLTPYQILSLGFIALIVIGTILLMLPIATASGEPTGFVDALFTSTSAVCVTGLSVVDTGTHYSAFGQIVIIVLIQIGAFGFMTMTSLMAVIMRRKVHLKERLTIQEELNQLTFSGVVSLTISIIKVTLLIEFIGGTLLALQFYPEYGLQGIYFGYWHAVSAFCNAGFDSFGSVGTAPAAFVGDFVFNMVITSLVLIGSLGFYVWIELWNKKKFREYSLQTKVVLATTAILTVVEMIGIFLLEFQNPETLGNLPLEGRFFASYFQAAAARTAGYTTVPIAGMADATLIFMMIFMFIGASPGSTGSGIKTTTFAVIIASIWSLICGHNEPTLFYRRIPSATVYKAFAIFFTSATLVVIITMLLTITEKFNFIDILFEVVSAFATTGLSTGITSALTDYGKLCLVVTMFVGRIGPVTFALALALKNKKRTIQYPEEKITIG